MALNIPNGCPMPFTPRFFPVAGQPDRQVMPRAEQLHSMLELSLRPRRRHLKVMLQRFTDEALDTLNDRDEDGVLLPMDDIAVERMERVEVKIARLDLLIANIELRVGDLCTCGQDPDLGTNMRRERLAGRLTAETDRATRFAIRKDLIAGSAVAK